MREEGYYWVKLYALSDWVIATYSSGVFYVGSFSFSNDDIFEIDDFRITKN